MITFSQGALSVTLRNPAKDDRDILNTRVRKIRTMDGSLRTYINTPASRTFDLSFEGILTADVTLLKSFILSTQGEEITYTDYFGTEYNGYILTDPLDFKSSGYNCDSFDFILNFKTV